MNETIKTASCDRENDLITFLYGEANESESRSFEQHLAVCRACQNEVSSFGQVRESIGIWKAEAFTGLAAQRPVLVRQKSALAAIREFFALSPLWLKGAVAFASLLFCALVVLMIARSAPKPPVAVVNEKTFTQDQVNEMMAKERQKQADEIAAANHRKTEDTATNPSTTVPQSHPRPRIGKSSEFAKGGRPLSKSEKQQLAMDLRLSSSKEEEDNLKLLTDRINQEF